MITIKEPSRGLTTGYLLHAGTALAGADLVTAGRAGAQRRGLGPGPGFRPGRRVRVAECVEFRGGWYRRDIAERASAGG